MYRVVGLRANPATSRVGDPWSPEEDKQMEEQLEQKMSLSQIAKLHQRTEGGIVAHSKVMALRKIKNEILTIEQASSLYQVSAKELQSSLDRKKEGGDNGGMHSSIISPNVQQASPLLELTVVDLVKKVEMLTARMEKMQTEIDELKIVVNELS
jgi:hypothetical protein